MSTELPTAPERACPVCGERDRRPFARERIDHARLGAYSYASRKIPEFMRLRLDRCPKCDLVYAAQPPAPDFLYTAYATAAFDSSDEAEAAARTYANALQPLLPPRAHRRAAIDVGAGSGPLLPWLIAQGHSPVLGIEPSHAAIAAAPPAIRDLLREGMFVPDLIGGIEPSLICSFMTLEHMADPGGFVRAAWHSLVPGGMLAIVVHNWRAPLNRLLGMSSPIIDIEHLQLFSPRSAIALLRNNGFDPVAYHTLRNCYPLRYWLRLSPFPGWLKIRLDHLLNRTGLARRSLALRVGNMIVLGTKPTLPVT